MSETIAVFGYGSLVTQATLPEGTVAIPGRLTGIRRAWKIAGETPIGRVCGLTALADDASSSRSVGVRGVLVSYPRALLPELDKREWRYDRHALAPDAFVPDDGFSVDRSVETIMYRVKPQHERWGDDDHPIIQSYIDCVLRGFFERWGSAGVTHFIETTDGWHAPIARDRHQPRYRRTVRITAEEEALFDAALERAGARWL